MFNVDNALNGICHICSRNLRECGCCKDKDQCVSDFIAALPRDADPRTISNHRQCITCGVCLYKCEFETCITCGRHLSNCVCFSKFSDRITLFHGRLWSHENQTYWKPWRLPDGDHGLCRCCEPCQDKGLSESECLCEKCQTCGDCENMCDLEWCLDCRRELDDCECDNLCGCCDDCEWSLDSTSDCECKICGTCRDCENTCLEQKCEKCFCHVVDDVCVNCGAIGRPDEGVQLSLKDSNKPMAPKRAFRSWSKAEKSFMRSLFISGMSLAEIANHLDRTENAVVVQLANLRLISDVDLSNAVHQAQLRYNRVINRDPEAPF